LRWLQAITRYGNSSKGTISGAPNFAYQLCVDKITPEERATLDLSSWEVAYCGAEPIRRQTMDDFAAAFAPAGFNPAAFYPCYGMAEATLIASGGDGPGPLRSLTIQTEALAQNRVEVIAEEQRSRGAEEQKSDATPHSPLSTLHSPLPTLHSSMELVNCGRALLDQQIVIAHPETLTLCAADEVGEIWIAGPSVTQGYWNRPELTAATFQATLGDSDQGPFLRTGDLGFLHEGDLYVTGRLKDLIIVHGRNHYPQDLENTLGNCHPALEPDSGAAFSVAVAGQERLVVVHEVARRHRRPNIDEVASAARQAVSQEHELPLYALVLVRPLSIPRTSSGKVRRQTCKQQYLDGALDVVAEWTADDERQKDEGRRMKAEISAQPHPSSLSLLSWLAGFPTA
jgi:acyl-CoA synthetase (AMP-forming)/AMP-acid ligase II